jgi:hypothetical protein
MFRTKRLKRRLKKRRRMIESIESWNYKIFIVCGVCSERKLYRVALKLH